METPDSQVISNDTHSAASPARDATEQHPEPACAVKPGQLSPSLLDPSLLEACIHCGLCLPACPTYLASGHEGESPRGRIYLLTLWRKGEMNAQEGMFGHLDSCLGCMGCQTACPSGVQYQRILTQARQAMAPMRNRRVRKLLRFAFKKLLPDYAKLKALGRFLRLWQSSGLSRLLPVLPLPERRKKQLVEWESLLPRVPPHKELPRQSWQAGEKRGVVQLFFGCVMDVFYNQVNHASIRLLNRQRRMVLVPDQTCCGALAAHAGEMDIARELARKNIELFEETEGDIVVTSAGCGAMLKEYGELFADDPSWSGRAHDFASRIKDVTEVLAQGEFTGNPGKIDATVAYHAACHLAHVQKVREAPRELLNLIPGIRLVPLVNPEHCCGSAGIYNLLHTELSMQVLEEKMRRIEDTGADIVVTTNPGCLLQLEAGADRRGLEIRVLHLVELLDEAF